MIEEKQPSEEQNPTLTEDDVRAIVRLLGKVAVDGKSLNDKRAILMKGMCELIKADRWVWGLLGRGEAGELPTFSLQARGGFTEKQFADYLKAQEHPDMGRYNAPFLAEYAEKGRHLTRLRQQIDTENTFPQSDAYALWEVADISPLIMSFRPNTTGVTSAVALFRKFGADMFSSRDSRIAHIILSEVGWIHEEVLPDKADEQMLLLSPRLNTVLNLLVQGQGRKQIAADLEISINTVNGYAKDLYRRFGVHSQAELINKFISGDGGDRS